MKKTLVTGGAKRLGAEICRTLKKEGHEIVIHYRSSENEAKALAEELNAECIYGDFSTIASTNAFIKNYLARFKETDVLINNVGNFVLGAASVTEPATAADLYQTNVFAPLALIQELQPKKIINLGMCGCEAPSLSASFYNMAKNTLLMLTKTLAKEYASHGITINMVSPGYLTNSVHVPKQYVSGRATELDEITRVISFLLSDESSHITGQNIEVAGGERL